MNEETGAQRCDPPSPGRKVWVARMNEARQSPGQWFRLPFQPGHVGNTKNRMVGWALVGEQWDVVARSDPESPKGGWIYYRVEVVS